MTVNLSHPPAGEVEWLVRQKTGIRAAVVRAQMAYVARDRGAAVLGVDRYDVTCERVEMVTG